MVICCPRPGDHLALLMRNVKMNGSVLFSGLKSLHYLSSADSVRNKLEQKTLQLYLPVMSSWPLQTKILKSSKKYRGVLRIWHRARIGKSR